MIEKTTYLKFYSRREIQEQIILSCKNKEVGTRFLEGHFGKRPDILINPNDVLELAKQGVTSFHISEESWDNPMMIATAKGKKDLDNLRIGWDLIIDIDCPNWTLSKRICDAVINILKEHDIKSIFCKFSGNKGFHIGVPFEAFPKKIQGIDSKLFFPDGVKRIIEYIVYYAKKNYSKQILDGFNISNLAHEIGVKKEDLFREYCADCNTDFVNQNIKINYLCTKCGNFEQKNNYQDFIECKCGSIMRPESKNKIKCIKCKSTNIKTEMNFELVLGLDEILISSRHLYRAPYSLHEKSGLVSIPIDINSVMLFEKEMAKIENISKNPICFLDNSKTIPDEAEKLIFKTLDYKPDIIIKEKKEFENLFNSESDIIKNTNKQLDNIQKVPIECFPPSILNILKGLKDGKKRALFILLNFLDSVGWAYDDIKTIITEWNKKNDPPLKDGLIKTHLSYKKENKEKILPPNYSNQNYYADLGILSPEEQTGRIKNPVTYALRKAYFTNKDEAKNKKQTKINKQENNTNKEKI